MSHAIGRVIKDERVIGYFDYDGTCDIAIPNIYSSLEELRENWRKWPPYKCECDIDSLEDVILYTDYGNGWHWDAKVCLKCGVINEYYRAQYIYERPSCFGYGDNEPDKSLIFYSGKPDYIEDKEGE
jgi:hypothetical protein